MALLTLLCTAAAPVLGATFQVDRFDDANCMFLSSRLDEVPVDDFLLAPLAMNGGRTPTHAVLAGSPVIDVAPSDALCPAGDQRDGMRPQDGDVNDLSTCDAGAYELEGPSILELPTLGEVSLVAFVLLLGGAGVLALRWATTPT